MSVLGVFFLLFCRPAKADNLINGKIDIDLPVHARPAAITMAGIDALPEQTRYELYTLYQSYIGTVNKRKEQHWHTGLLSGEIIEHPEEAVLPARQIEEAAARRETEVAALQAQLAQEKAQTPPPAPPAPPAPDRSDWTTPTPPKNERPRPKKSPTELALKAKLKELKSFKRQLSRSKGLSIDWSDAVWADLQTVDAEHWSISDRERSTSPRHTGAVVCAPSDDPTVCLVFDPWKTGEPDAYDYSTWDRGSFEGRVPSDYLLHNLPDKP